MRNLDLSEVRMLIKLAWNHIGRISIKELAKCSVDSFYDIVERSAFGLYGLFGGIGQRCPAWIGEPSAWGLRKGSIGLGVEGSGLLKVIRFLKRENL